MVNYSYNYFIKKRAALRKDNAAEGAKDDTLQSFFSYQLPITKVVESDAKKIIYENLGFLHELAENKNGKLVSLTYKNPESKLQWQCEQDHIFKLSLTAVNSNYWCAKCDRVKQIEKELDLLNELAKKKGGKCLSLNYGKSDGKLKWECGNGHNWRMTLGAFKQDQWCDTCNALNRRKDELKELKLLAIEKGGRCLSKKFKNKRTKLKWQCHQKHTWLESANILLKYKDRWCPKCAGTSIDDAPIISRQQDLNKYQHMARQLDGELLSTSFADDETLLKWKCHKGHIWEMDPLSIKNGLWCLVCFEDYKQLIVQELRSIAKEHRGELLTTDYIDTYTKMKWRCENNHTWTATANYIQRGDWCPICSSEKSRLAMFDSKT